MTLTINTEAKTIYIEGMVEASVLQAIMASLGDDLKYYSVGQTPPYTYPVDVIMSRGTGGPFIDPLKFTVTC